MARVAGKTPKLRITTQGKVQVEAIQRYLDSNADFLNLLAESQILSGRLMEDITVATGVQVSIKHGLARQYRGVIPVLNNGTITSLEIDNTNPRKKSELHLTITGTATLISLWVF